MRKKRIIGLVGAIAGTISLLGSIELTRLRTDNRELERNLDIYLEQPQETAGLKMIDSSLPYIPLPDKYDKLNDNPRISHPQSGRCYTLPTEPEVRMTHYIDECELEKKCGKIPFGNIGVCEEKIGEDLWRFKYLNCDGINVTKEMVEEVRKKVPWIFDASEQGKPYTLQVIRDKSGRARELVYNLQNGKKVILKDKDGNCKVDEIENH